MCVEPALDGDAGEGVVADQGGPEVGHLTRGQGVPLNGSVQVEIRRNHVVKDTVTKELKLLVGGRHCRKNKATFWLEYFDI